MPFHKYVKRAKKVLDKNWTGEFTMPSVHLYPHQWNWDSGFIAIGYSHYDTKRAIKELTHLFNAQWENGMIPQIVFNKEKLGTYFPEPDFWQVEKLSPYAPEGYLTSGITMPPIHAVAVLKIYKNAKEKDEVIPFLKWIYPKLLKQHRYLYRERSPENNGLVYIRHPWESGMDNSPTWDSILDKIDVENLKIPKFKRKDINVISQDMRPKDIDYKRYIYLVELFKKHRYLEDEIRKDCPFLVYDPLFNSILSASNKALVEIGTILEEDIIEPEIWYLKTKTGIIENLFNEEAKIFDAYDLKEKKLIKVNTAAGFMPLFGEAATKYQAEKIYEFLNSTSFCALHQGNCFTIPNYNIKSKDFDRKNYWRGPVWININWMLYEGLKKYGYREKSIQLAKNIFELPVRFGFYEYFDSFDGRGYGTKDFSWTAALFIDVAKQLEKSRKKTNIFKMFKTFLSKEVILNEGESKNKVPSENLSQEILLTIKDLFTASYAEYGSLDYPRIKQFEEYKNYKELVKQLKYFDISQLDTREKKLSFWINLFNAMVIDGIIALEIQESVKEVLGFFSKLKYEIGGYKFSLNDIYHGILRSNKKPPYHPCKQFKLWDRRKKFIVEELDPRIHFALACGTYSCAPIKFYTADNIDLELDLSAKSFINSSEVIIIPEENRIILSYIFKWYEKDFGGLPGILGFIDRYLVDDDKRRFLKRRNPEMKIEYMYYDWNLNKY